MKNKAVIFDLDGTLWDAIGSIKEGWNLAMKSALSQLSFSYERIKSFMGLTPEETISILSKEVPFKEAKKLFYLAMDSELKYLKDNPGTLYPDEEKVLKKLSEKYTLFVVSNAVNGYIDNYINYFHFDKYFSDFLCAGDTNLDKCENIKLIMKKHNIDKAIYVGDTQKDMIESNKAGVYFVHAKYGFGKIKENVTSIDSLSELPHLVDDIFSMLDENVDAT